MREIVYTETEPGEWEPGETPYAKRIAAIRNILTWSAIFAGWVIAAAYPWLMSAFVRFLDGR